MIFKKYNNDVGGGGDDNDDGDAYHYLCSNINNNMNHFCL